MHPDWYSWEYPAGAAAWVLAQAGTQPVYDEYKVLVAPDQGSLRKHVPGVVFLPTKHLALLTWA